MTDAENVARLVEEAEKRVAYEAIARVAHEVNRAYCVALGDASQPDWYGAPQWQRESALDGVRRHVANPGLEPAASHAAWMELKLRQGWRWGPVKDAMLQLHPCLMAFDELPRDQQAKDYIFAAVVRAMAANMGLTA
jgi:hypothetical protein